ncbi:hypothetical protein FGO68_gene10478 [Halteria grandinella]|uniref:Potassium channel domain-containing protein n=1 Tax=Halteria grandinella TaxID=5974 RepID=A0A8J8NFJ3_HALGN|nr:hypothetical protein FGO68_gene10478 [Halteria grandinella]
MYWDWVATIFRGVLVFLVPLEISFNPGILTSDSQIAAIILFIILQLDFFVKINTICYQHGKAIVDRWEILKQQINRSVFIDYCLTFILIFLDQIPEGEYNLIQLLLLVQLTYIYDSFLKMDQISYLTRPQRGRLGLIKFMVTLIYVAHIFSCIWFWFSSIDQQTSWIITKGLEHKSWQYQYLEAIYFAVVTMLTIGYGDNVPINSIEKIITIIFILCACLWFSYSINFIGGIINDITQNQVERNQKMRVINKYMNERAIPYALQYQQKLQLYYRIKEYLTYRWKEDDEVDLEMEQALLGQLSDEMKEELDKQAYKIFIKRCDFLQKNFSLEFRNALFKSIKRKIILPQNTFSTDVNGEPHLIFLEQGVLLYQHKDRKQRSKINAQINQGSFVCLKSFIEFNPEKEYFKAAGYVSLLVLAKSDFLETLNDFPEDCEKFCQLKDKITTQDDDSIIKNGSFCPVCSQSVHSLKQCPFVQLIPDRELIIKRHNYNTNQQRKPFKRRVIEKPIMTRAEMLFVQECARIFGLDNPQLVQNQLKSQLTQDEIEINYMICDELLPSVKIFPQTQEYLVTSSYQGAVKNIESENQLDAFIERRKKSQPKVQKPIIKIGSINYDHRLLRQNTRSPSMLSQLNEPSIENSPNDNISINGEIDEFKRKIGEFNQMHAENVIKIFKQLQKYDDQQMNKAQKDLSFLYFALNNQTEDLDQIHDYDHYFPEYNICTVLESINKNKQSWQTHILKRYSQYMFYPFQFILKFLKFKRSKAFISIVNKFETIQRVRHKMILLRASKNSFKRNKVLPEVLVKKKTKFLKNPKKKAPRI